MPTPASDIQGALAVCLDDLEQGVSLEACLARFPQYATELAPLLEAAARVREKPLPALSLGARVRGRERMHDTLAQRQARHGWWRAWMSGIAVLAFLLVLAAGVWLSSPGRDSRLGVESTQQPAAAAIIASPMATMTETTTPDRTPTREGVISTATQMPTPMPEPAASPTSMPWPASTNAPPSMSATPKASSTARLVTTPAAPTVQTRETPRTPEATEVGEMREPNRAPATSTPRPLHSATPTPPNAALTPHPTERPEVQPTSYPIQSPGATPTPLDDDEETPSATRTRGHD